MDNKREDYTDLNDIRTLVTLLLNEAKFLWSTAIIIKIIGASLAILFILINNSSPITPVLVLIFTFVSEICIWHSDTLKGRAENIKRKLEYADGFGWPISREDLSDYFASISEKNRLSIANQVKENYFASKEKPGSKRGLQNLQESAWWSKNLSNKMIWYYGVFSAILVISTFITFMISISSIDSFNQLQIINRIIISVVSVTLSLGISKLIIGYIKFNNKSEKIEKSANQLLKSNSYSEIDAIKLLHEYQLARSSSPFIPNFIWRMHRNSLNVLWQKYRNDL